MQEFQIRFNPIEMVVGCTEDVCRNVRSTYAFGEFFPISRSYGQFFGNYKPNLTNRWEPVGLCRRLWEETPVKISSNSKGISFMPESVEELDALVLFVEGLRGLSVRDGIISDEDIKLLRTYRHQRDLNRGKSVRVDPSLELSAN